MGKVLIANLYAVGEETPETVKEDLTAHIQDGTPHPAYDDIQSLTGLFENGIA